MLTGGARPGNAVHRCGRPPRHWPPLTTAAQPLGVGAPARFCCTPTLRWPRRAAGDRDWSPPLGVQNMTDFPSPVLSGALKLASASCRPTRYTRAARMLPRQSLSPSRLEHWAEVHRAVGATTTKTATPSSTPAPTRSPRQPSPSPDTDTESISPAAGLHYRLRRRPNLPDRLIGATPQ